MKKRILSMFLAVAMMFSITGILPVISAEESFNYDLSFTYTRKDGTEIKLHVVKCYYYNSWGQVSLLIDVIENRENNNYVDDEILAALIELDILDDITTLHLIHSDISDYTPLNNFPNLVDLGISRNEILNTPPLTDLSPLSELTNIKHLWLGRHGSDFDLTPLIKMINLEVISLEDNQISDISPLKEMTNLIGLELSRNKISDISPLKELTSLIGLLLANNQISDVSPLSELTNLTHLSLYDNQISDVSPLKGLTNLIYLALSGNYQINSLSPLKGLTNLEWFFVDGPVSADYVSIFVVLEILKSLAGMENELDKNIVSLSMTLLTEESRAAGKPTIFDALEILKKLAGM